MANYGNEELWYTPAWFAERAKDYPDLDTEANVQIAAFREKFAPEKLKALSGEELLCTMFFNDKNSDNFFSMLESGTELFGRLSSSDNKYDKRGLYCLKDDDWCLHKDNKREKIDKEKAIIEGTKIRDSVFDGIKVIDLKEKLESEDDYENLYKVLRSKIGGLLDNAWLRKYYYLLFPDKFVGYHLDNDIKDVLAKLNVSKGSSISKSVGKIKQFINECEISSVMFSKIFTDFIEDIESKDEHVEEGHIKEELESWKSLTRNRIFFGAPGTGKSYTLNKEGKGLIHNDGYCERVTFYPDYSYGNFVGTYKPIPTKDSDGKDSITYEYVPGPFIRTLTKALKNFHSNPAEKTVPHLLIIEEINRANAASVFGDVFQLLDRNDAHTSEYPIQTSEDLRKYLARELDDVLDDCSEITIPSNMFIWASMNSADQGVFPMDTAFKRRWDFTYIGINDKDKDLQGKTVELGSKEFAQAIEWNKLRRAINDFLAEENINEDKQLGPYFMDRSIVVPSKGGEIDRDKFIEAFKNKVIMYLFEDAARQRRSILFEGCECKGNRYSKICEEFDAKGIKIFNNRIHEKTLESEE